MSKKGGLIQLAAGNNEDPTNFIVNEPEITFFKTNYRRHLNFSKTEEQLPINGNVSFGSTFECEIPKNGDYIHKLTLLIKLPELCCKYKQLTKQQLQDYLKKYNIDWDFEGNKNDKITEDDLNDVLVLIENFIDELKKSKELYEQIIKVVKENLNYDEDNNDVRDYIVKLFTELFNIENKDDYYNSLPDEQKDIIDTYNNFETEEEKENYYNSLTEEEKEIIDNYNKQENLKSKVLKFLNDFIKNREDNSKLNINEPININGFLDINQIYKSNVSNKDNKFIISNYKREDDYWYKDNYSITEKNYYYNSLNNEDKNIIDIYNSKETEEEKEEYYNTLSDKQKEILDNYNNKSDEIILIKPKNGYIYNFNDISHNIDPKILEELFKFTDICSGYLYKIQEDKIKNTDDCYIYKEIYKIKNINDEENNDEELDDDEENDLKVYIPKKIIEIEDEMNTINNIYTENIIDNQFKTDTNTKGIKTSPEFTIINNINNQDTFIFDYDDNNFIKEMKYMNNNNLDFTSINESFDFFNISEDDKREIAEIIKNKDGIFNIGNLFLQNILTFNDEIKYIKHNFIDGGIYRLNYKIDNYINQVYFKYNNGELRKIDLTTGKYYDTYNKKNLSNKDIDNFENLNYIEHYDGNIIDSFVLNDGYYIKDSKFTKYENNEYKKLDYKEELYYDYEIKELEENYFKNNIKNNFIVINNDEIIKDKTGEYINYHYNINTLKIEQFNIKNYYELNNFKNKKILYVVYSNNILINSLLNGYLIEKIYKIYKFTGDENYNYTNEEIKNYLDLNEYIGNIIKEIKNKNFYNINIEEGYYNLFGNNEENIYYYNDYFEKKENGSNIISWKDYFILNQQNQYDKNNLISIIEKEEEKIFITLKYNNINLLEIENILPTYIIEKNDLHLGDIYLIHKYSGFTYLNNNNDYIIKYELYKLKNIENTIIKSYDNNYNYYFYFDNNKKENIYIKANEINEENNKYFFKYLYDINIYEEYNKKKINLEINEEKKDIFDTIYNKIFNNNYIYDEIIIYNNMFILEDKNNKIYTLNYIDDYIEILKYNDIKDNYYKFEEENIYKYNIEFKDFVKPDIIIINLLRDTYYKIQNDYYKINDNNIFEKIENITDDEKKNSYILILPINNLFKFSFMINNTLYISPIIRIFNYINLPTIENKETNEIEIINDGIIPIENIEIKGILSLKINNLIKIENLKKIEDNINEEGYYAEELENNKIKIFYCEKNNNMYLFNEIKINYINIILSTNLTINYKGIYYYNNNEIIEINNGKYILPDNLINYNNMDENKIQILEDGYYILDEKISEEEYLHHLYYQYNIDEISDTIIYKKIHENYYDLQYINFYNETLITYNLNNNNPFSITEETSIYNILEINDFINNDLGEDHINYYIYTQENNQIFIDVNGLSYLNNEGRTIALQFEKTKGYYYYVYRNQINFNNHYFGYYYYYWNDNYNNITTDDIETHLLQQKKDLYLINKKFYTPKNEEYLFKEIKTNKYKISFNLFTAYELCNYDICYSFTTNNNFNFDLNLENIGILNTGFQHEYKYDKYIVYTDNDNNKIFLWYQNPQYKDKFKYKINDNIKNLNFEIKLSPYFICKDNDEKYKLFQFLRNICPNFNNTSTSNYYNGYYIKKITKGIFKLKKSDNTERYYYINKNDYSIKQITLINTSTLEEQEPDRFYKYEDNYYFISNSIKYTVYDLSNLIITDTSNLLPSQYHKIDLGTETLILLDKPFEDLYYFDENKEFGNQFEYLNNGNYLINNKIYNYDNEQHILTELQPDNNIKYIKYNDEIYKLEKNNDETYSFNLINYKYHYYNNSFNKLTYNYYELNNEHKILQNTFIYNNYFDVLNYLKEDYYKILNNFYKYNRNRLNKLDYLYLQNSININNDKNILFKNYKYYLIDNLIYYYFNDKLNLLEFDKDEEVIIDLNGIISSYKNKEINEDYYRLNKYYYNINNEVVISSYSGEDELKNNIKYNLLKIDLKKYINYNFVPENFNHNELVLYKFKNYYILRYYLQDDYTYEEKEEFKNKFKENAIYKCKLNDNDYYFICIKIELYDIIDNIIDIILQPINFSNYLIHYKKIEQEEIKHYIKKLKDNELKDINIENKYLFKYDEIAYKIELYNLLENNVNSLDPVNKYELILEQNNNLYHQYYNDKNVFIENIDLKNKILYSKIQYYLNNSDPEYDPNNYINNYRNDYKIFYLISKLEDNNEYQIILPPNIEENELYEDQVIEINTNKTLSLKGKCYIKSLPTTIPPITPTDLVYKLIEIELYNDNNNLITFINNSNNKQINKNVNTTIKIEGYIINLDQTTNRYIYKFGEYNNEKVKLIIGNQEIEINECYIIDNYNSINTEGNYFVYKDFDLYGIELQKDNYKIYVKNNQHYKDNNIEVIGKINTLYVNGIQNEEILNIYNEINDYKINNYYKYDFDGFIINYGGKNAYLEHINENNHYIYTEDDMTNYDYKSEYKNDNDIIIYNQINNYIINAIIYTYNNINLDNTNKDNYNFTNEIIYINYNLEFEPPFLKYLPFYYDYSDTITNSFSSINYILDNFINKYYYNNEQYYYIYKKIENNINDDINNTKYYIKVINNFEYYINCYLKDFEFNNGIIENKINNYKILNYNKNIYFINQKQNYDDKILISYYLNQYTELNIFNYIRDIKFYNLQQYKNNRLLIPSLLNLNLLLINEQFNNYYLLIQEDNYFILNQNDTDLIYIININDDEIILYEYKNQTFIKYNPNYDCIYYLFNKFYYKTNDLNYHIYDIKDNELFIDINKKTVYKYNNNILENIIIWRAKDYYYIVNPYLNCNLSFIQKKENEGIITFEPIDNLPYELIYNDNWNLIFNKTKPNPLKLFDTFYIENNNINEYYIFNGTENILLFTYDKNNKDNTTLKENQIICYKDNNIISQDLNEIYNIYYYLYDNIDKEYKLTNTIYLYNEKKFKNKLKEIINDIIIDDDNIEILFGLSNIQLDQNIDTSKTYLEYFTEKILKLINQTSLNSNSFIYNLILNFKLIIDTTTLTINSHLTNYYDLTYFYKNLYEYCLVNVLIDLRVNTEIYKNIIYSIYNDKAEDKKIIYNENIEINNTISINNNSINFIDYVNKYIDLSYQDNIKVIIDKNINYVKCENYYKNLKELLNNLEYQDINIYNIFDNNNKYIIYETEYYNRIKYHLTDLTEEKIIIEFDYLNPNINTTEDNKIIINENEKINYKKYLICLEYLQSINKIYTAIKNTKNNIINENFYNILNYINKDNINSYNNKNYDFNDTEKNYIYLLDNLIKPYYRINNNIDQNEYNKKINDYYLLNNKNKYVIFEENIKELKELIDLYNIDPNNIDYNSDEYKNLNSFIKEDLNMYIHLTFSDLYPKQLYLHTLERLIDIIDGYKNADNKTDYIQTLQNEFSKDERLKDNFYYYLSLYTYKDEYNYFLTLENPFDNFIYIDNTNDIETTYYYKKSLLNNYTFINFYYYSNLSTENKNYNDDYFYNFYKKYNDNIFIPYYINDYYLCNNDEHTDNINFRRLFNIIINQYEHIQDINSKEEFINNINNKNKYELIDYIDEFYPAPPYKYDIINYLNNVSEEVNEEDKFKYNEYTERYGFKFKEKIEEYYNYIYNNNIIDYYNNLDTEEKKQNYLNTLTLEQQNIIKYYFYLKNTSNNINIINLLNYNIEDNYTNIINEINDKKNFEIYISNELSTNYKQLDLIKLYSYDVKNLNENKILYYNQYYPYYIINTILNNLPSNEENKNKLIELCNILLDNNINNIYTELYNKVWSEDNQQNQYDIFIYCYRLMLFKYHLSSEHFTKIMNFILDENYINDVLNDQIEETLKIIKSSNNFYFNNIIEYNYLFYDIIIDKFIENYENYILFNYVYKYLQNQYNYNNNYYSSLYLYLKFIADIIPEYYKNNSNDEILNKFINSINKELLPLLKNLKYGNNIYSIFDIMLSNDNKNNDRTLLENFNNIYIDNEYLEKYNEIKNNILEIENQDDNIIQKDILQFINYLFDNEGLTEEEIKEVEHIFNIYYIFYELYNNQIINNFTEEDKVIIFQYNQKTEINKEEYYNSLTDEGKNIIDTYKNIIEISYDDGEEYIGTLNNEDRQILFGYLFYHTIENKEDYYNSLTDEEKEIIDKFNIYKKYFEDNKYKQNITPSRLLLYNNIISSKFNNFENVYNYADFLIWYLINETEFSNILNFFEDLYNIENISNLDIEKVKQKIIDYYTNQIININNLIDNLNKLIDYIYELFKNLNKEYLKCCWKKEIGHYLIKKVDLLLGDCVIDSMNNEFLHILYETELDINQKRGYDIMIGNIDKLNEYNEEIKPEYDLFIPLQFSFNKYLECSLPLFCLVNSPVKIRIQLNNLKDLIDYDKNGYIEISNKYLNHLDTFMLADYYILDYKDRLSISKKRQQILIEQIKYFDDIIINLNNYYKYNKETKEYEIKENDDEITEFIQPLKLTTYKQKNNLKHTINLHFEGLSKELYIVIQQKNKKNDNNYNIPILNNQYKEYERYNKDDNEFIKQKYLYDNKDSDEHNNYIQFKDVSNNIIYNVKYDENTETYEYINEVKDTNTNTEWKILKKQINEYNDEKEKENNENKYINMNPIKSIEIKYNGKEREQNKNIEYYDLIQKYQYHKVCNNNGINIYSFALYPEDIQPSGTSNLGKIGDLNIEIIFNEDVINTLSKEEKIFRIGIYSKQINFLRMLSGIGAPMFM